MQGQIKQKQLLDTPTDFPQTKNKSKMELPSSVLTRSYNQFSLDLYRQVANGSGNYTEASEFCLPNSFFKNNFLQDSNIFLCTYSILSALSMCLPGARQNTEKQLKDLLNFQNYSNNEIYASNFEMLNYFQTSNLKNGLKMTMANKVYPQTGFSIKPEFVETLQKYYKVDVQTVDFSRPEQTSNVINEWVAQATENKITDLIPASAISSLTRMVLVNGVYFKGSWLKQFNKDRTRQNEFKLLDGTKDSVDMMDLQSDFKYLEQPFGLKANVLEMPYDGQQVSMTIILPNENVGIHEIESQLTDEDLFTNLLKPSRREKVHVFLPKFKLEESVELSGVLSKMNASDAFTMDADFSGITGRPDLYISKVVHKAIVDVSEAGTEAAGATGVVMNLKSIVNRPPVFNCDRPFIFVLHDSVRHNVLFMGRYAKPNKIV